MTTERTLLDALHRRLGTAYVRGTMPPRHVLAEHVCLHPQGGSRIADAISVDTWGSGGFALSGYEVKVSRGDWLRELKDPTKAEAWARHCRYWWLVTLPGILRDDLPPTWGALVLRGDGRLARHTQAPRRTDTVPVAQSTIASLLRATHATASHRVVSHQDGAAQHGHQPPEPDYLRVAVEAPDHPHHDVLAELGPVYTPDDCPVWTCERTHAHTHPERIMA